MALQLLVLFAMIFGPLSSWLAARRGRSPVAWLVLGAAAGPVAAALVAFAPPGHCPRCGSPVRGWPSDCSSCGHALSTALVPSPAGARPDVATGPPDVATGPPEPVVRRRRQRAATATDVTASAGNETGSVPATREPVPAAREMAIGALPLGGAWIAPDAAPRPAEPKPIAVEWRFDPTAEPERTVLADAVFVGGTMRLLIGVRYVIAVEGDDLLILDPLAEETRSVTLRQPRARLAVIITDDGLVLEEVKDGPAFTAAFRRVSVAPGRDLARDVPLVAVEVPAPTPVGGRSGAPDGPER